MWKIQPQWVVTPRKQTNINPRTLFFRKANTIALHFDVMSKFTLYLQLQVCSCRCDLNAVSHEEN
jgi:hypothetical protein